MNAAPRFLACLFLAGLLVSCGAEDDPSPTGPNVLVVIMDCGRADHCSFLGYDRPTTPRLASFAREGITFTDAWVPGGWTGPTHASLFTGLLPEKHGFYFGCRLFLLPEVETLAEILQEAGYATSCVTSNAYLSESFGLTQGFDKTYPVHAMEGSKPEDIYRLTREAVKEAGEKGSPFFIFVNDLGLHLPYTPSEANERAFLPPDVTDAEIEAGRGFGYVDSVDQILGLRKLNPRETEILTGLYDAEMLDLDERLGRFLEQLAEDGILDDTVVIVTADHGENLGDHGLTSHMVSLHRSVRRVPLVIRYPGSFEGGGEVEEVVRLEDLFPTILTLCDVEVPPNLDGVSLLGDLSGRISRALHGPPRLADTVEQSERWAPGMDLGRLRSSYWAVYDGRLHYIRASDGREELYDVTVDPEEKRNLAGTDPESVRRMERLLQSGR